MTTLKPASAAAHVQTHNHCDAVPMLSSLQSPLSFSCCNYVAFSYTSLFCVRKRRDAPYEGAADRLLGYSHDVWWSSLHPNQSLSLFGMLIFPGVSSAFKDFTSLITSFRSSPMFRPYFCVLVPAMSSRLMRRHRHTHPSCTRHALGFSIISQRVDGLP